MPPQHGNHLARAGLQHEEWHTLLRYLTTALTRSENSAGLLGPVKAPGSFEVWFHQFFNSQLRHKYWNTSLTGDDWLKQHIRPYVLFDGNEYTPSLTHPSVISCVREQVVHIGRKLRLKKGQYEKVITPSCVRNQDNSQGGANTGRIPSPGPIQERYQPDGGKGTEWDDPYGNKTLDKTKMGYSEVTRNTTCALNCPPDSAYSVARGVDKVPMGNTVDISLEPYIDINHPPLVLNNGHESQPSTIPATVVRTEHAQKLAFFKLQADKISSRACVPQFRLTSELVIEDIHKPIVLKTPTDSLPLDISGEKERSEPWRGGSVGGGGDGPGAMVVEHEIHHRSEIHHLSPISCVKKVPHPQMAPATTIIPQSPINITKAESNTTSDSSGELKAIAASSVNSPEKLTQRMPVPFTTAVTSPPLMGGIGEDPIIAAHPLPSSPLLDRDNITTSPESLGHTPPTVTPHEAPDPPPVLYNGYGVEYKLELFIILAYSPTMPSLEEFLEQCRMQGAVPGHLALKGIRFVVRGYPCRVAIESPASLLDWKTLLDLPYDVGDTAEVQVWFG